MPQSHAPADAAFVAQSYADLVHVEQVAWLWQEYLAAGDITLLTSQWKSGKTTLVAALLHQMKAGGTLAGLPVCPGKAAIVSEEKSALWYRRGRKFDLNGHVCWFCRPFRGKPTLAQYQSLVDHLLSLHKQIGLNLVVIDTLSLFLPPGSENHIDAMTAALTPLKDLAAADLAVLLLHHPRRRNSSEGNSSRGSGALVGQVDILIEMRWVGRPSSGNRRRRLLAWSRYSETTPRRVIELDEAGILYTAVADDREPEATPADPPPELIELLGRADYKLTRKQILKRWPDCAETPSPTALWDWLARGVRTGRILRQGEGRGTSPFRYWLPEREQEWLQDPIYRQAAANFETWKQMREEMP